MPIPNYTTRIQPEQTCGQIMGFLSAHGARQIMLDYDDRGRPDGLSWTVSRDGTSHAFRLPLNVTGVLAALNRENVTQKYRTEDHAYRVAWAICRDWVRAQIAAVEAGLVDFEEVFLPYMLGPGNKTLYDHALTHGLKGLLPGGEG